ncbi:ImmA/IrrE family metallo-endopeptidase [Thermoanaerobacterium thermosaccharolyticum]|uniref:ImmA/IrrE family metallo-endopeptidase n=1 Tax=Thermoanaerobacterium thermosaccharolyticum TaxID=1517 RepID=UPI00178564CF|nr:ImmA/IrrE family metallo-endopeptidase [Thermoanaerobacterium thermosaccharolyticum]MBE0069604.1 ImmA/IrrE family metallo-endopeptidase [Thermoanaerobacterium thermosaccharolyticum]MBE0229284.1 ImmA/IrrE family metallo-endopeptidase [Thermoanaerobacterium thermosaccharolyticum]
MRKNNLNLPEESFRLQIKDLAEDVRMKFARKGLSDIFDILSEAAFLIRKPLDTDELSGFSTYFEEQFIVYLNSNFTLGHERYTGAHELYHLIYNADILKKEKILLDDEKHKAEDTKADVFASEFLMPEDYVKEVFYKIVNVDKDSVLPRHIIRMHNYFKVSYKAMLKRLIQLDLCSIDKYEELVDICSLEKTEMLQSLTRREGYSIDLITPSKETYVPKEYIEFVKTNYERGNISYKNMKTSLEFIGLTPEQFGYEYPLEEDY